MSNTAHDTLVSFEELDTTIREVMSMLDASAHGLTRESPGTQLRNLQSTVYGIDAPVVYRQMPFELHKKAWMRFVSGDSETLDKVAIKYLCWVPEIATDERFLLYVENSAIELKLRSLAGLVRSCHYRWEDLSPESASLSIIKVLLKRYNGPNQVLHRWQRHPDTLLGQNAPLLLAEMFIRAGGSLRSFLDEWRLDTQSSFFQTFIGIAAARCRAQINRLPDDVLLMLFRDLLSWQGWDPSAFKKEIGALILQQPMGPRIQEVVQRFILHHKDLGDPRLRINGLKWSEVPLQARKVFVEWLSLENPLSFNEHIFQQGKGWTWRQQTSKLEPLSLKQEEWR
jgi:hypothetical protein